MASNLETSACTFCSHKGTSVGSECNQPATKNYWIQILTLHVSNVEVGFFVVVINDFLFLIKKNPKKTTRKKNYTVLRQGVSQI